MPTITATPQNLLLSIQQEVLIKAPLGDAFDALLEQLGPGFEKHDGEPMPLKIEAWPGGRWMRDLGNNNGHFWGVVQAIKRPTLLEFHGPMSMSLPVAGNIQFRLSETPGGTMLKLHHQVLGPLSEEQCQGMKKGWAYILGKTEARTL